MRHRKISVRFGRHSAHRKATLASLVSSLIKYNRIETTLAKAKETKRLADRLITWGKKGQISHRRLAYSLLGDRDLIKLLFKDIAPLFAKRQGGYTRIIHTRTRVGDAAQMAILEWTEIRQPEPHAKKPIKKEPEKTKETAHIEKDRPKVEEKSIAAQEKLKQAPIAPKPKAEEKPSGEQPKKEKGFLGGLRKLFDKKKKD